jgi:thiamine-monophosphate kinase
LVTWQAGSCVGDVTVGELGERQLIERIRGCLAAAAGRADGLVIGIGDDAAVVKPMRGRNTVLTTDAQVEGVHFERRFSDPGDIGARALAVNLSDLAAMGAVPRWALLSLVLPVGFGVTEVEALVGGIAEVGAAAKVTVIGGNVTRSPGPLMVDVTAVGDVHPRRVLTRGGGRPGDELYVSGSIGAAAAGLEMLREGGPLDAACVAKYRRPAARTRLGQAVAQARAARAAMDLSDGLADALRQVAEASGCGVEVDAGAIPVEPAAREWWTARGSDALRAALSGGDDYELLFAVPRGWRGRLRQARQRVAEPALTRIGVLTKDKAARVMRRNGGREDLPGGFEHFS